MCQDSNTYGMLLIACCKFQMHDRLFAHLETMRTEALRSLHVMPRPATVSYLLANCTGDRQAIEHALRAVLEASRSVQTHYGGS